MHSDVLSAFFRQEAKLNADVLLPDDYYKQPERRFPTVYFVHAFDGSSRITEQAQSAWQRAQRTLHAEFIVIFLDANLNGGHHEFADSPTFGPWGTALAKEFIPKTDGHFRTMADSHARFICGHSSGGWASLWVQITNPQLFGGVWSISPDPVDFRDFTGPDLTKQPPQNFYRDMRGGEYRTYGGTLKHLVTDEPWGIAQFDSFEEVFSPTSGDGKPEKLFDRRSGAINSAVARYWEENWDIDHVLLKRWPKDGVFLKGKIHIFVGDADSFGLDRPVRLMQAELAQLDADAQITFVPRADHWTVYNYNGGLIHEILKEMSAQLSAAGPPG